MSSEQTPKDILKGMAHQAGCTMKDLLVLAPNNDPYNCGSATQRAKAEWFASIYRDYGFERGVHLRRMHYKLVSHGDVVKHDGEVFQNTDEDWGYITEAAKHARYLGLVNPCDFVDRRNPEPVLYAVEPNDDTEVSAEVELWDAWKLPTLDLNFRVEIGIPDIFVSGYSYDEGDQPVHLECWIEKSTMSDVLLPLCRRYNANYVGSAGFQSVTAAVQLLERIQSVIQSKRPVRIFYISDFDPAGDCMPVAVARQLQFWINQTGVDADVKLTPLALTAAQVKQYNLPRVPVKASDLRKANFEDRHGEGAVELDALEALHPGVLSQIVEDTFRQYRDESLEERMDQAWHTANRDAEQEWQTATENVREMADELKQQAESIVGQFEDRFQTLKDEMTTALQPIADQIKELEPLAQDATDSAEQDLGLMLPCRPEAQIEFPDEADWLFDSGRDYGDQLGYFRIHQNGGEA
jgi:hypothetical protein